MVILCRKCCFQCSRELKIQNFTQWGTYHGGASREPLYYVLWFFKKSWVTCLLWRFCEGFSYFPHKLTASLFIAFWYRSFIFLFRKIFHFWRSWTGRSSSFGSNCWNGFVVQTDEFSFFCACWINIIIFICTRRISAEVHALLVSLFR